MSDTRIEVGDYVDVFFTGGEPIFNGKVVYIPNGTGDSWILLCDDGKLRYVQMFEQMTRVARGDTG